MTHFPTVRRHASIFTMDWRGRGTERDVKLQLFGCPQGSRAYEAIERSDDKHRLEIHVESIESSTFSTLNPINPKL